MLVMSPLAPWFDETNFDVASTYNKKEFALISTSVVRYVSFVVLDRQENKNPEMAIRNVAVTYPMFMDHLLIENEVHKY